MFDRSGKNPEVRVPEYTFLLLPLSLVHFGFCTNLVRFRFSSLNKLFARTAREGGELAVPNIIARSEISHISLSHSLSQLVIQKITVVFYPETSQ